MWGLIENNYSNFLYDVFDVFFLNIYKMNNLSKYYLDYDIHYGNNMINIIERIEIILYLYKIY